MKKNIWLVVSFCMLTLPVGAVTNFYRAPNGNIVVETNDCTQINKLMQVAGLPDDPPGGASPAQEQEGEADELGQEPGLPDDPPTGEEGLENPEQTHEKAVDPSVVQGDQQILQAVFGREEQPNRPGSNFQDISAHVLEMLSTVSFDERQEYLLTFVREVNWKTGLQITWRDMSFFRRLKMACSGLNQVTKPLRIGLESYVGSLDEALDNTIDEGIEQLAHAVRSHSFSAMTKLSLVGVADVIDKENPFLLLLIDEDTYTLLVEMEPKVKTLFEDLYVFFAIRAVRMDPQYDRNTKELIRVSRIGRGDSFNTWHVMAEYAKKLMKLEEAGKLTVQDEKDIHLWKLENSLLYIKDHVRVERRAAELVASDPDQATLVQEAEQGAKKKVTLDERARELIQKSTQEELKRLVRKYIVK